MNIPKAYIYVTQAFAVDVDKESFRKYFSDFVEGKDLSIEEVMLRYHNIDSIDKLTEEDWSELIREWFVNQLIYNNDVMKSNGIFFADADSNDEEVELTTDEDFQSMLDGEYIYS